MSRTRVAVKQALDDPVLSVGQHADVSKHLVVVQLDHWSVELHATCFLQALVGRERPVKIPNILSNVCSFIAILLPSG